MTFTLYRYRVIVPDYRGAGLSSKPDSSFTKTAMAEDIIQLLDHLSIAEPVHIIGHDIGGMIAYAFASRHPERSASVIWGECPLPGTTAFEDDWTTHATQQFHFHFHNVPDLPEALVTGREEIYLEHFYNKIGHNKEAISRDDLAHYAAEYKRPGSMHCAFEVYRAFLDDAKENRLWVLEHGRCRVKALGLSGGKSRHAEAAQTMMSEVHEPSTYRVAEVDNSGHWIAEENPEGFVRTVLEFIEC